MDPGKVKDFLYIYEKYKKMYRLRSIIRTNLWGDNHVQIWQEKNISDSRLIVDVTAESEEELYAIAQDRLVRYFEIFR